MQKFPELIIAEARSWVGTPYHHQAVVKRVGVDCVGLILGVGMAVGLMPADTMVRFSQAGLGGYSRTPNPNRMRKGMELFLQPLPLSAGADPSPGMIGWFEWRQELPMHLGIVAEFEGRLTMIHAFSIARRCVENTLDEEWRSRVNSWWAFKGSGF